MTLPLPSSFHSDLTNERLHFIASEILDVHYKVEDEMHTEDDDNYTRGTTKFGRTKNRLITMITSRNHSYLSPVNMSNKFIFRIGSVECRFFEDDYLNPTKKGFFKRGEHYDLFPIEDHTPVYWSFVIDNPDSLDDEIRVNFVGYNACQEVVSVWNIDEATPTVYPLNTDVPKAVDIPPAHIDDKEDDQQDDGAVNNNG